MLRKGEQKYSVIEIVPKKLTFLPSYEDKKHQKILKELGKKKKITYPLTQLFDRDQYKKMMNNKIK